MTRLSDQPPSYIKMGADGIAISADGQRLFYCALASRKVYSVSVDALVNEQVDDAQDMRVNLRTNPLLNARSRPFSFPRSAWECITGGLLPPLKVGASRLQEQSYEAQAE